MTPPAASRLSPSRLADFGAEIDAIKDRATASLGPKDVAWIDRIQTLSSACEAVGRVLLHVSFEPITFTLGVIALFVHKQLEIGEIGHMALHGAWDGLPGAEAYRSRDFVWNAPIDERAWKHGHNVRHHQYTNIAGRDPDIHFGRVRLNERTPHAPKNRLQLFHALLVTFPSFAFLMNLHVTGALDTIEDNGRGGYDHLPDLSRENVAKAWWRVARKAVPYYLKNLVLFPLLAGPGFMKVLAGNVLAELLRDLYSAATIYCGHVGEAVADYPEGTRAHGRAEWYAMQVESSNNFQVSLPLSVLCGALDFQIEHHLFPKLPPNRLREVAPAVRAVCDKYGVAYRTGSWPATLGRAIGRVAELARPPAQAAPATATPVSA